MRGRVLSCASCRGADAQRRSSARERVGLSRRSRLEGDGGGVGWGGKGRKASGRRMADAAAAGAQGREAVSGVNGRCHCFGFWYRMRRSSSERSIHANGRGVFGVVVSSHTHRRDSRDCTDWFSNQYVTGSESHDVLWRDLSTERALRLLAMVGQQSDREIDWFGTRRVTLDSKRKTSTTLD